MKVVVTGASGWMARELISGMLAASTDKFQILPVARSSSEIFLDSSLNYTTVPWKLDEIATWAPEVVVHSAFITRDRMHDYTTSEYELDCRRLTERALNIVKLPSVRSVLLLTSGAALVDADSYSLQKRHEEARFQRECNWLGRDLLLARLWSVSGRFCTKPEIFAFSDFVTQAIDFGRIQVRSTGPVWRKYVDAQEYLLVCLNALLSGRCGEISSTGTLVELHDLARMVGDHFNATVEFEHRSWVNGPQDSYYSNSPRMEIEASQMDERFKTLDEQIETVGRALQGRGRK